MIPIKLSLTNFMCYRYAELNLAGVHVACLSGNNGVGKSALLDAMTWALWGRARAQRDDELIRTGEGEMAVEFSFELDGGLYRVVRRRKGGRRGISLLDFQVHSNGQWRSIAENAIRQTQDKIERLLRLDYDTFVNSAFLRQGRADEFTVKTPAERKRLLGEILGLGVWTVYEERAKTRLRAVQEEARALRLRLQEIEAEIARRPEFEAQAEQARAEVAARAAEMREAYAAWQALEAARSEARHVQAQMARLGQQIEQAQQERAALERERAGRESRLAEYGALLAQADEIESGFAAYQEALERERAMAEKLAAQAELNEQRRTLEARIAEARHALQTRRQVVEQQCAALTQRLSSPALLREYDEAQVQLAHLRQVQASQDAARADLAQLAEERAGLQAQNRALRSEMDALKARVEQLEQAGAECPLCGQPLADEDRLRLLAELRAEGTSKGDTYRANRARLDEIAGEMAALEEQIAQSQALLEELPGRERQVAALAERIRAGEEAAQALEAARGELAALDEELAAGRYAPEAQEALAAVLARAAGLGYDAEAYAAARQAVVEGQVFAQRKTQLDAARTGVAQEQEALRRLGEAESRWQAQQQAAEAELAQLEGAAAALAQQLAGAEAIETALGRAQVAEAEARQRLGAAQQRLKACDDLAQQQASRLERQRVLAEQESIYQELWTAFGVQGVPAMIIEAAVPEIEAEANRLLHRLTAGQMSVRLETQRETLAGAVRETLDIRIMDAKGERAYETYSGGEQFRINFALRIALSRLLARRAGAQLSTLIIDEGFGSQDAGGRERLVEVIHAIQDEFARILVITHVEELRDAFPTRIEISGDPEGSQIAIY